MLFDYWRLPFVDRKTQTKRENKAEEFEHTNTIDNTTERCQYDRPRPIITGTI